MTTNPNTAPASRPPLPPFTEETARQKVQLAEDAWNSRDPERVSLAYTPDTEWRNRAEFVNGREEVVAFLRRKWVKEYDYRLRKTLWAFTGNRIAVRFEYEWHDGAGQWWRSHGNENWEFDADGLMARRYASINDQQIAETDRKFRWTAAPDAMAEKFMQLVLTPEVKAAQERYFGRHQNADAPQERDPFGEAEAAFIATRDSSYMASINSEGWPYIQHRGGPPGFLKVLGTNHLGFADFKGNRQMITTGNLDGSDRVALFLMDYPNRQRLKILGHARVLDARENAALVDQLSPARELRSRIERLFLIDVVSYDWNCPQYITARFTEAEVARHIAPLKARIAELEEKLRLGATGS